MDEDPELDFGREEETGTSGTGYTTASESKHTNTTRYLDARIRR
jgi:hypothetical protein